jgi:NAD(P)-dependent dehydrogenase (short-subunit alcohol dehydrogenase family)
MQDYSKEFEGKKVLITGGSRGIGAATAQRLIDGGAKVVVTARSRHEETPAGATFITGDLRSKEGAEVIAKEAIGILGGLDILVHSAGAARVQLTSMDQIPEEEWLDSLDINFLAGLRITNAILPKLRESGLGASILYVSAGGLLPFGGPLSHYGAAKAAMNNYALNLAKELAPAGIRVNIVTPGPIITPGGDDVRKTITAAMGITEEQFFSVVPLQGRGGKAEELGEAIAFLVSDRASYITGHNQFVTGGWGSLV